MTCAACGRANPGDNAFCGGCGAALGAAAAPARLAGERRQLTVMFCDVVDSTALAAALDPEDYQELHAEYLAVCNGAVARYGGHVAQYLGDGVLTYFGYPNAHEDDPERAVRAALDVIGGLAPLRRRAAEKGSATFAARVGVHTGLVVVGAVGGAGRVEQLALGDTPNLAARIQALAEPDSVLVSEVTARRIGARLLADPLGQRALRGVTEPIGVYRVRGLVAEVSRPSASGSALIGRGAELAVLRTAFASARSGAGRFAFVSGEAGMGKTRLCEALRDSLSAEPHTWVRASCSAFQQANPLLPFADSLRRYLGVAEDVNDSAALLGALERAGLPAGDDRATLAGLLGAAPGEAGAPERMRRQRMDALLRWLLALAGRRTLVLAVEDLHWADPTSLELIGELKGHLAEAAILCVATARPELAPPWRLEEHDAFVSLERLTRPEIETLVRAVWQGAVAPELASRVAERADGVPLFAEEIAKAVRDTESGDLAIPATLQDSLNARLDGLGHARELAQRAAVIGREFSHELLEALYSEELPDLDRELRALVRAEIVRSVGGEGRAERFEFRHGLLRDAAYAGILRRDRRALHARVSDALETRFRERGRRAPELVAHHAAEAGRPLRALTEWHRAARRASRAGAPAEAEAHLRHAFEQLPLLEDRGERARHELGLMMSHSGVVAQREGFASERYMALVRRADALCESLDFPVLRPWLLGGISTYHAVRGETPESLRFAEEGLALAEKHPTASSLANAHLILARARLCHGEYARAVEHAEQAIRTHKREEFRASVSAGADMAVAARAYAGLARFALGDLDAALADCAQALSDAESLRPEEPVSVMTALELASWHWIHRGEAERALPDLERALEIAEAIDDTQAKSKLLLVREIARVSSAPSAAGVDSLERLYAEWEKDGSMLMSSFYLGGLAEGLASVGRLPEALARAESALRRAEEMDEGYCDADLLRIRAVVLAKLGRLAESREGFARALERARARGAAGWERRVELSRASFATRGDTA